MIISSLCIALSSLLLSGITILTISAIGYLAYKGYSWLKQHTVGKG